jgi:hypothetical protein
MSVAQARAARDSGNSVVADGFWPSEGNPHEREVVCRDWPETALCYIAAVYDPRRDRDSSWQGQTCTV